MDDLKIERPSIWRRRPISPKTKTPRLFLTNDSCDLSDTHLFRSNHGAARDHLPNYTRRLIGRKR